MLESEELKRMEAKYYSLLHIAPEYPVGQLLQKRGYYLQIHQSYMLI